MIFAIEDLARDMGFGLAAPPGEPDAGGPVYAPTVGQPSIPKHVRKLEKGNKHPVSYSEFNVTGLGSATPTVTRKDADAAGDFLPEKAVADTIFDIYRKELCRSEDVTLKIQFPKDTGPADGSRPWWAQRRADDPVLPGGGEFFHVMTGAGIEGCMDTTRSGKIYVADPDKRNRLVGGAYTGEDVRERYPYTGVPFPAPVAGATEDEKKMFYDEFSFDANGCITASPSTPSYVGACIRQLTAISPTPEPGTAALLGIGLGTLVALARRRRNQGGTPA
jgi:hypothetical protein